MLNPHQSTFVISCLALATALGCDNHRTNNSKEDPLSVEEVRNALIELLERSDNAPLKMSLQTLRTAKPVKGDDGDIRLGPWIMNLNERRFGVSIIAEPIFEEYGGKFFRNEANTWAATIDHETRN